MFNPYQKDPWTFDWHILNFHWIGMGDKTRRLGASSESQKAWHIWSFIPHKRLFYWNDMDFPADSLSGKRGGVYIYTKKKYIYIIKKNI